MCEPLSLLALAGSVAAAGVSYMGQQATVDAQNKANQDWVNYQRAQAQKAAAQDEALRQKAQAAAETTQQAVNPQTQEAEQKSAESDIYNQYTQGTPLAPGADPNTALLSGQQGEGTGVSKDMSDAMAARVTAAAREAQGRLKAAAALASYGSGYGGVANTVGQAITQGNQDIALTGDERQGVAKTLGVAQNVQPVQYTMGQDIAGSIAGTLANVAGSAFGTDIKTGKVKLFS
jgi:hypothetical protein